MNLQRTINVISSISIFSLIGIGLNIFLVYTLLRLWICPQISDIELIFNLIILLFFEFIMTHSGVFMSLLGRSWKGWLFFTLFYGLFALAFNAVVSGNQIIILYGAVVLNRMLPNIFSNPEQSERAKRVVISGLYAMIYFLLLIVVILSASHIPQFGLTEEFLEAANYSEVFTASGNFSETPHVFMCFGVLYYLALTLMETIMIKREVKKQLRITN